jgi:hypothetical protein
MRRPPGDESLLRKFVERGSDVGALQCHMSVMIAMVPSSYVSMIPLCFSSQPANYTCVSCSALYPMPVFSSRTNTYIAEDMQSARGLLPPPSAA